MISLNPLIADWEGDNNMIKLTLKAARVNAGLTQKSAANRLGVSNKTLCGWENGATTPNIQYVNAMCELYGVSYDDLNFLPDNPLKAESGEIAW
jgi:DNA-binding XRE family transcriptional regulator